MKIWDERLQNILIKYEPKDIYNANETELFYKLTPERTFQFKSVTCSGGKRRKASLTALVCANMTGDDKIPLYIIGKSSKPRCFKNVKTLPTEYVSKKDFGDWRIIKELDNSA